MSIFDTDLVTSELHVPLRDRFAIELSSRIKSYHRDLIEAKRTHGVSGVMSAIDMMVLSLTQKQQYASMTFSSNRDIYMNYPHRFVTEIKGNFYIVIEVRQPGAKDRENFGTIFITLDKYLRETKFKVKDYKYYW